METNNEQKSSVKLIKGQKDSYGWEIKVYQDDVKENELGDSPRELDERTILRLKTIDERLKKEFGGSK